jgi:transposase InsO family protein
VRRMQTLYREARGRKAKGRLLDQVGETLGRSRRQAKRLMRGKEPALERPFRHREPVYPERLIRILEEVWKAAQCLWSVRLKEALPLWLPAIKKRWRLDPKEEEQLLAMSPATMDRRLASYKSKVRRQVYGKTKPGRWLRQSIPIQTESWDVREPGWMEVDTVSHSGPSAAGVFGYSLAEVDLFSGWVEVRAVLGKKAEDIVAAQEEIRQALPFAQKGIDSDNGDEFINWEMDRYCRGHELQRFRSRPNKKDDQAHVEQKNGTHVRRLIGWDRYDTSQAVAAMNSLYREEWRWLTNLFLPSVKLAAKLRVGSRIKRVYREAQTPLDRLLESEHGDRDKLDELRRLRKRLDPFELAAAVDKKLDFIWKLASKTKLKPAAADHVPVAPKTGWWERFEADLPAPLFLPFANMDLDRIRKQWYQGRLFGTN